MRRAFFMGGEALDVQFVIPAERSEGRDLKTVRRALRFSLEVPDSASALPG